MLSDWSSLHLDLIAHDRGLKRLAASLYEFEPAPRVSLLTTPASPDRSRGSGMARRRATGTSPRYQARGFDRPGQRSPRRCRWRSLYCQRTHAVMMATPCDLEDLAIGFSLSEGIVDDAREIHRVTISRHSRGIELRIDVSSAIADRLLTRVRALAGRTGCGLCGVEAIEDAVRVPARIASTLSGDSGGDLARNQRAGRASAAQ